MSLKMERCAGANRMFSAKILTIVSLPFQRHGAAERLGLVAPVSGTAQGSTPPRAHQLATLCRQKWHHIARADKAVYIYTILFVLSSLKFIIVLMMLYLKQAFIASALLAAAHGQAVIKGAKGQRGSPFSQGLQVQSKNPNDANFISDVEITTNVVNECGRTLQGGNIDIGENTENALAAGQVTQTTAGGNVKVFIKQVNQLGSGPFTCDMDQTSNSNGVSGQTPLTVRESQPSQDGVITLRVAMPNDMKCIGASTGNVCTIRCRNANNFGGCVAVQQTDTQPNKNDPTKITTAQTLDGVLNQVAQNIKDVPFALEGIAQASQDPADQGTSVVKAIQAGDDSTIDSTVKFSP
ncbi:hypothetical protein RRF57_007795 [Xylaria bambusicola]|uniref:Gas1-like protein n=1 Tax=Xylaria bambusicola TaxID=326684 RepID=A0AAN7UU92_9PEZI